jgi:hypothetical protein
MEKRRKFPHFKKHRFSITNHRTLVTIWYGDGGERVIAMKQRKNEDEEENYVHHYYETKEKRRLLYPRLLCKV